MLTITKTSEPDVLKEIRKLFSQPYKGQDWEDKKIKDKHSVIRIHILKNEQNWRCAFCNKKYVNEEETPGYYKNLNDKDKNHIDHFLKRELYPKLTFDYNNMFVSCNSDKHCARYKDNMLKKIVDKEEAKRINQLLLKPTDNICDYITYDLFGLVHEQQKLSEEKQERAAKTIEYFNLGHENLRQDRRSLIIGMLHSMLYITNEEMFVNCFAKIMKNHLQTSFKISLEPKLKNLINKPDLVRKFLNTTTPIPTGAFLHKNNKHLKF